MKRKWNIPIDEAYCLTMGILLVLALFFKFALVGYRFLPVVFAGVAALITCWKLLGMLKKQIDTLLSDFEKQVLEAFLDGKSYQEIAEMLDRHVKSIDNALQRIKRKLLKYLEEK